MKQRTTQSPPLSFKQVLFLVLLVPLIGLGMLELIARGVLFFQSEQDAPAPVTLEMPTWMLNDANATARKAPSSEAMDWLTLFEEGDGFRVRLIPNIRREVQNTFSLIPADRSRRYLIESNSLGFRGKELTPTKPENTFRILVFGDSSSFGWGVNPEDSWSVLLEQELQRLYPDRTIEVGNFAIPGDSSAYGRLLFETFAPRFQSDLVILGFGANDAKHVWTSHTEQVALFSKDKLLLDVAKLLRYSALYQLLEKGVASVTPTTPPERPKKRVPAVSLKEYAHNLREMGSTAKALGNDNTLLLALCTPNSYAKKARKIANKENFLWLNGQARLIDLIPQIESGELYPSYVEEMRARYPRELRQRKMFYITSDGCHPNELGHRFVADALTEMIKSVVARRFSKG